MRPNPARKRSSTAARLRPLAPREPRSKMSRESPKAAYELTVFLRFADRANLSIVRSSIAHGNATRNEPDFLCRLGTDGAQKYSYADNFVGGTGKFRGIRGQLRDAGERAPGAKSLTESESGEYWVEE